MKKISILIPTYNEEENVPIITQRLIEIFKNKLVSYDYEILFIDNKSKDNTRQILRKICNDNKHIKAIFNARNFGQSRSPYYGMLQTDGDCTISMCADLQDPPEMIIDFVREWEKGFKIVIGIKNTSKENKFMYYMRSIYYKCLKRIADTEQIEHFTGFGLYDKSFVQVLKNLEDPSPYFRGIVAELGFERKEIYYTQNKRERGKTSNNFFSLYDYGMLGITSYSKAVLRLATWGGFFIGAISFIIALVYLVLKLIYWDWFMAGMAPVLIGMFFLGAIQLFFIGILGEYIMSINIRVMKRPLVVEEERINFSERIEE